jgi:murein endopeptidase
VQDDFFVQLLLNQTNNNAQPQATTPTLPNMESMLNVWYNQSSHTQTTREKQPKPKKQLFPKPPVWCKNFIAPHPHKESKHNTSATQTPQKDKKILNGYLNCLKL